MESHNYQGGKAQGERLEEQKAKLAAINDEMFKEGAFKEIEDVEEKLEEIIETFIKFDKDMDGLIGVMDMKQAMEDMGQAKTHLEVMKMIKEVDKESKDAINYREFIDMMLGTKQTVLKLILLFESKAKKSADESRKPPPKKAISDLP